jgi:pimeloyl-ACP methyl ester carboxylesterase
VNIVVNGLLTNYELSGKGKLVVFLHGWGDSFKSFKNMTDQLSAKYKVLAIDLPGFGGSEQPKETWNLDNYSNFLAETLNKLQLGETYAFIGHSNGGAISIRAISLAVVNPAKLILIASSGIRSGRTFKKLFINFLAKIGNVATIWMPERYRNDLRKSLYQSAGSDALLVPEMIGTFERTVKQDVQSDAANITVPTLLIFADNDKAVPLSDARRYNELIKNSKLEIVKDAGHFVHQEKENEVLKLIESFLD